MQMAGKKCSVEEPTVTAPTISELLARLEEQQARIERLEAGPTAPAVSPAASVQADADPAGADPADADPADGEARPAVLTRRGMVRTAAAGAAGVVGAMLVESGGVASAADAGPASFTSSTTKPAVTATNTGKGNGLTAHAKSAPAIHGSQTSTAASGVGVRGTIDSTNGAGTGVLGISPSGAGVQGSSTSGAGVQGSSTSGTGVAGSSTSGTGVAGSSTSGIAVTGSTPSTA